MGKQKEKKERGYRKITKLLQEQSDSPNKQGLLVVKNKRMVTSQIGDKENSAISNLIRAVLDNGLLLRDLKESRVFHAGPVSKRDLLWLQEHSVSEIITV